MPAQRKLVYHVATTLDGFIALSDHSFGCFIQDGQAVEEFFAQLKEYGGVIMGRRTYDIGYKQGVTNPYAFLPTYVVSRTLPKDVDSNVEVVHENPIGRITSLKQQAGRPLWLCGGSELATQLFNAQLIDEVVIKLNPVLLGAGIPVVAALPKHVALTLRDSKRYDSGLVLLKYEVINS